eukprot:gene3601-4483_t
MYYLRLFNDNSIINNKTRLLGVEQQASGLHSIVNGKGINSGDCGSVGDVGDEFSFQVISYYSNGCQKKKGGDIVSVQIQGCDYQNIDQDVKVKVIDRMNGTHIVYYNVSKSGHYMISVFVNHVPVVGSPFKINVSPLLYNLNINQQQNNNDSQSNTNTMIIAGEQTTLEMIPMKISNHRICDQIDLMIFFNENGTLKRTNTDITIQHSDSSDGTFTAKMKLAKSGQYMIEGYVVGVPVFSKTITVVPGPVSSKYSHLIWAGKELISEHKLFILKDKEESQLKFNIETKDQYGNIAQGKINHFKFKINRSLQPIRNYDNNNNTDTNNNGNTNQFIETFEISPSTIKDQSSGVYMTFTIKNSGWYQINAQLDGVPITNSPFTLIAVKESDFQTLSNYHSSGKAVFNCQIEKNNKLSNVTLTITPSNQHLNPKLNVEESLNIISGIRGKDFVMSRLIVKFNDEDGVDIGGISKEWFGKFSEEIGLSPIKGFHLFDSYPETNRYHPSPFSNLIPGYRKIFNTLGKITAKSILDSVLKADRHFSLRFTNIFYKLLTNEPISIHDMETIDPQLYKNQIQFILNNPMETVNEILGEPLYFVRTIHYKNCNDEEQEQQQQKELEQIEPNQFHRNINLKPFGNLIKVTDENKMEYLELLVNNIFYQSVKIQVDEFREGFFEVIPQNLISVFNWRELETLICGKSFINISDLKLHSIVTGCYSQEITDNFWAILQDFTDKERKSLLKFVTGSSSVPLGGFYQLCPHFTINIISSPNNVDDTSNRLPVSHTCFNRLDIPKNCLNYDTLKSNILLAINEASEGFSLV